MNEIIQEALERFNDIVDNTSQIREEMEEDLKFCHGDQWDDGDLRDREQDGRPSLTVNRLPTFINQVVNDQRMNRPQIQVRPVDNNTDPKTAEVINGILRHIQTDSVAKVAFDTSMDYSVRCGAGYFRILTDYCNDDSFDQEIKIERIDNPFSVYIPIHNCKKHDFSDMEYGFITQTMSKAEFERQHPDVDCGNWDSDDNLWITADQVIIAEYFCIKRDPAKLYAWERTLEDGQVETGSGEEVPEGATEINSRDIEKRTVKWYKLSPFEILEESTFPGKHIPIIPVLGQEIIVEGEKHFYSMIRWAKDPQRLINYWKSCKAERIALAPKAPYVAAVGQIEDFREIWTNANRKNYGVLPYKPVSASGQMVPPPQRMASIQMDSALIQETREAVDDLKATTGIYDASLGAQGNETSGRAIIARQREGDTANYHFVDNLSLSMQCAGRIIVDMIPVIYDTPRVVRIVGEDMADDVVMLNQLYRDPKTNEDRLYDMTAGKYDVVVTTGPNFATKRAESAEALLQFIQAYPNAAGVAGDLIAKFMDFPGADILSERLKKIVPPEALTDEEQAEMAAKSKEDPRKQLAAVVGDLQKMMAENQQLKETLAKVSEQMNEDEKDLMIAVAKNQTDIEKAKINASSGVEKANITSRPNMVKAVADLTERV